MKIGNLKSTASRSLSTFVLACSIVTVGLLFVIEKAERAGEAISFKGNYSTSTAE